MKELSIEEKAKRYDEALKVLHKYDGANIMFTQDLKEEMFPELKESDDDVIRKAIIGYLKHLRGKHELFPDEWIAWLEKQGEHYNFLHKIQIGDQVTRNEDGVLVNLSQLKRVAKKDEKQGEQSPSWSEEDKKMFSQISDILWEGYKNTTGEMPTWDNIREWCLSIKERVQPQYKQGWSQNDIDMIDWLIRCCEKEHEELCNDKYGHQDIVSDLKRDCRKKWNWLESLKNKVVPQNTWKPSEEQLEAINTAINVIGKGTLNGKELIGLLEQLKAL